MPDDRPAPAAPAALSFTEALRARGRDGLVALLTARPDLAAPPPSTLRSLAARACGRGSLERALAGVDALVLQTLEAVLALDGLSTPTGTATGRTAIAAATGADEQDVAHALAQARALALLHGDDDAPVAAPGLSDVLGPYPAGLGPSLTVTLARRSPEALRDLAVRVGEPEAEADVPALARRLADADVVLPLLADAPAGARAVLDALLWGPPVGVSPGGGDTTRGPEARTPARTAVDWLLRHGLLAGSDGQHVLLPREVALALRGGRTHRTPAVAPSHTGTPRDPGTVDAEAAGHAQELVRRTALLLETWGAEPPAALRSGGLGARELRRTALRLGVAEQVAALVVEIAGAADLVAADGEDPAALVPTTAADDWLALPVADRWAVLAGAWLRTERVAWLVGTRDERGALRPALDPEARRPWAPRLRRQVLDVLALQQDPRAWTPADAAELLHWRTPRNAPAEHAVAAVLQEAGTVGVLGAGALSPAGRALLHDGDVPAALAAQLPPAVEEVLLQGDLTGIVPGRPSEDLATLLDETADVESRGSALTVRFSETSVRRALDLGRTGEDVLAGLSRHARTGVPQPLEYLVLDTARRHGRLRVGAAASYVRAEDPGLLVGLVEDKALRGLGLVLLAPTVLAAQVPPAALLAALRERGLAPVAEDGTGAVVVLGPRAARIRVPRDRARARTAVVPAGEAAAAQGRRLARLAGDLLRPVADDDGPSGVGLLGGPVGGRGHAGDHVGNGTPDPVAALDLLREAVAESRTVWVEIVDGAGGLVRRRVRPLRVEGGRVRAVDADREAEITVAVHRIAHVSIDAPADPDVPDPDVPHPDVQESQ